MFRLPLLGPIAVTVGIAIQYFVEFGEQLSRLGNDLTGLEACMLYIAYGRGSALL
jgi:hypothetical protein